MADPDAEQTIVFQGRPGAYSHLACTAARPDMTPRGLHSFDACFDAVQEGRAALAMLPVENSMAGRVADLHRLLPQRSLHIVGEHFQPVHHHLLAKPGTRLQDVKTVISHPQALAQCRHWLKAHELQPSAWQDTSSAAQAVAEGDDPTVAAIASGLAGELMGLQTLAEGIQDQSWNTTRFLIMAPRPLLPLPGGPCVTSCLFSVRNRAASLYKALGGFATNGVNLLKLESYQLGGFQWTQFAVDFEGRPTDPGIEHALEELEFFCTELRVLGTYAQHEFRRKG